jgi:LacI family transcriptional regulator
MVDLRHAFVASFLPPAIGGEDTLSQRCDYMQVRLIDIAEQAGVSVATVSHVLGGKRADRYTAETRQRIEEAARALGYRPNTSARAMRSGYSGAVALLLPIGEGRSFLPSDLLAGIHDTLALQGRHLIVARSSDDALKEKDFVPRALKEWMADGLLVNYIHQIPPAFAEALARPGAPPTVWLNVDRAEDAVRPDDDRAGYEATRYLLERGHTRIAYVSLQESRHYSVAARKKGYERALTEAGRRPRSIFWENPLEVFTLGPALLQGADPPTALVVYESFVAVPLLLSLARAGIRVPEDLSLITFHESALEWDVGLSVTLYLLPEYALGQAAAEQLARKLSDQSKPLPTRLLPLTFHFGTTVASL